MKKREFSPMKCQTPNPSEIFCHDCAFRDKTTVDIRNKTIAVGVTKANCDIFVYPNLKPHEILFDEAPCDYWVKDQEVIE